MISVWQLLVPAFIRSDMMPTLYNGMQKEVSIDSCSTYSTCLQCTTHPCHWVVHSEHLPMCTNNHCRTPYDIDMVVGPRGDCPPESSVDYFTTVWILTTVLLMFGFHFLRRRFLLTRFVHVPTPSGKPETSEAQKNNYPAAVESFQRAAPSNGLEKVGTISCEVESVTRGTLNLEFASDRMIACLANGTVKLWDWRESKENTINFGTNLKDITSLQYDEEIVVLGTAAGTVHLFDAKKLEEKWSLRFVDPVDSFKFFESTLVILTRGTAWEKFWWVEISRLDMKLVNRKLVLALTVDPAHWFLRWFLPNMTDSFKKSVGFLVHSEYCYLYEDRVVRVRFSKSGDRVYNPMGLECKLLAANGMVSFQVTALISTDGTLIAGCKNGTIVIWNTCKLTSHLSVHNFDSEFQQFPIKIMKRHTSAIRSLCTLNEHLLSVDQSGKLYMWSGYDLECKDIDAPVPRVLAQNFLNVSCLAGNERWFASGSSENGIISIWALPDLWLRSG